MMHPRRAGRLFLILIIMKHDEAMVNPGDLSAHLDPLLVCSGVERWLQLVSSGAARIEPPPLAVFWKKSLSGL
jgi:hypothetical protein